MEVTFKEFINYVSFNLSNVLTNLPDVCECAVHYGAYCGPAVELDDEGNNQYLALEFPETIAPWDRIETEDGSLLTKEEFKDKVLDIVRELIEAGALDDDDEDFTNSNEDLLKELFGDD